MLLANLPIVANVVHCTFWGDLKLLKDFLIIFSGSTWVFSKIDGLVFTS